MAKTSSKRSTTRASASPLTRKKNVLFKTPPPVNPYVKREAQDYTCWLRSAETLVPDFDVHWITKFQLNGGEDLPPAAAYTAKHQEYIEKGDDLLVSSNIKAFMPRRDSSKEGQFNLIAEDGKDFDWQLIVTERFGEDDTAESMGRSVTEVLNKFSDLHRRNKEIFRYSPQKFGFKEEVTSSPPKPLNHYVCDVQCVLLMKELYAEYYSKEEVMANDETLIQFFGSLENGLKAMEDAPKGTWD